MATKRKFPALCALWLTGCALVFPAPSPMRSKAYARKQNEVARCLAVLLPGMGDRDLAYEKNGFIDEARKRGLSLDLVAADATFGYYSKRTVVERLETDVLAPARARRYQQVWLVGISMGGMGGLLYATQKPGQQVDGILLLAPYLGPDSLLEEIESYGRLDAWKPGPPVEGEYQREIWRWLQAIASGRQAGPTLYLGAGEGDKLRKGHQILGAALPPERVLQTEGGHDWPPWRRLWAQFLDGSELQRACAE